MLIKRIAGAIDSFKKYRMGMKLNVPVHPDVFSILSVVFSFVVFYNAIAAIFAALLADLLGGAVARGRNIASRAGEVSDWVSDRCSEFIIFGYFAMASPALLILPVINIALNIMVAKDARIGGASFYVLPIRQVMLAALVGLYAASLPL